MAAAFIRFRTQLLKTGANTTGIEVPAEVIAQLNAGARPALVVRVNDYTYRTTVGVMGAKSLLPFSAQHREASGIQGGDAIQVAVQIDDQPHTLPIPQDLAEALAQLRGAKELFLKQAPSRRRADIANVTGAKSADTRARRIAAIVTRLTR